MPFWPLVMVVAALGLGACQTAPVSPSRLLSKPEQAALGTVDGIVSIPQGEPDVVVSPTGSAGAGGFVGALVYGIADGIRKAQANKEARALVEGLQGYNFKDDFLAATTAKFGALANMEVVVRPTVNTVSGVAASQVLFDESKDASVLFVSARISFNSGNLVLTAAATIFPKSPQLKQFRPKPDDAQPLDLGNAIYINMVRAVRTSVTPANVRTNLVGAIDEATTALAAGLERTR